MTRLKRPLCWLTRHHWLLQHEEPVAWTLPDMKLHESIYTYQCQSCGQLNEHSVVSL